MTQAIFTLDLERCTGCAACAIACTNENDVGEGLSWRQIATFNEERVPGVGVFHYSLACNHCAEPACMYGCPARAYRKDERTGAVLLDADRCIGCGYCAWVCPYDAPQYNPRAGVMEKCTFCSHRLAEAREPACVEACPVEALGFEWPASTGHRPGGGGRAAPIADARHEATPDDAVIRDGIPVHDAPRRADRFDADRLNGAAPGFPDTGLGPGIRIDAGRYATPPGAGRRQPESRPPTASPRLVPARLRGEWPLLLFSLVVTWMVAVFAAAFVSGATLHPLVVPVAGAFAMGVSTLHLGRPLRAWRALAGLGSSWVSREVVGFSLFWVAASATFGLPSAPPFVGWAALAAGFATLIAMDLVYSVPGQRVPAVPHGAMTVLTALFLLGLLLREPWIAATTAALKLVLWPWRELPPALTVARIGTGFAWPLVVWLARPDAPAVLLLAGPAVGEALDRLRFYAELEFLTPRIQIARDLARAT